MDYVIDDTIHIDVESLEEKILWLEKFNEYFEDECVALQRRLWLNFQDMICVAHILEKFKETFGTSKVQQIIDDFMQNEKEGVLSEQLEILKKNDLKMDYLDVETLFNFRG
jgi:hypothetical protein